MSAPGGPARSVTVRDFGRKKEAGEKLVVVSAYDALFGRLADDAGVDCVLVGDSLGNVVAGLDSTLPVTLDQMIYHGAAVRRGVSRALVLVDMPFLTYQVTVEDALRNCGRVMQETNAGGVKLEGASAVVAGAVRAAVEIGIPVMGHLGFTPQSVHALGGYRVQGREENAAKRLIDEARRLEDAGAFSIVLELLPSAIAAEVTAALRIPTIGIGAGTGCDGQVLVLADLLGLNDRFTPKFLKRYASMADDVRDAVRRFGDDVRGGRYPDADHSF
ncbi:MAG TPA: 3-methyl-2-oxobutanoate hydroxymethyltransferase [Gemmatimonadaceae bacterium]|nr:3-methyl-2-oxobutanoate hydroxymethyltransferase [Gemmatimonadaceae bacterium]